MKQHVTEKTTQKMGSRALKARNQNNRLRIERARSKIKGQRVGKGASMRGVERDLHGTLLTMYSFLKLRCPRRSPKSFAFLSFFK